MAKKILILFLCLLLIGCAAEQPVTEQEKKTTTPSVEVEEVEETPEMSQELMNLIAKSDKVESMDYSFSKVVESEPAIYMHVYVKGNKMKQEFPKESGVVQRKYTVVYLDISEKTAYAYCKEEWCDNKEASVPVSYGDFIKETPLSLLKSIDYAEIVGSEYYDKNEATIIQLTNDQGNIEKIWVWEYRGIPLKYEVYDSAGEVIEKVEYKGMVVNQLKDSDVEP